ncbi:MAG: hypothetical protein ACOX1X_00315 [Dethiobacteria bacterium]
MDTLIYAVQVQTGFEKVVSQLFRAQAANEALDLENIELHTF